MQDLFDWDSGSGQRAARAGRCETADSDNQSGLEEGDSPLEGTVARLLEGSSLGRRKPIRSAVAAALLEEQQRAVVVDEEACEEPVRRAERVARPPP
jgi:hypothetical protein